MARTTAILRADAIFDLAVGLLLLLSPWKGLFDALDLPHAEPELFVQVAGGLLVAFAYLLWLGPRDEALAQVVSAPAAVANTAGAVVLAGWLLVGDLDTGALGTTLLTLTTVLLVFFAVAEARIASTRVNVLLIRD